MSKYKRRINGSGSINGCHHCQCLPHTATNGNSGCNSAQKTESNDNNDKSPPPQKHYLLLLGRGIRRYYRHDCRNLHFWCALILLTGFSCNFLFHTMTMTKTAIKMITARTTTAPLRSQYSAAPLHNVTGGVVTPSTLSETEWIESLVDRAFEMWNQNEEGSELRAAQIRFLRDFAATQSRGSNQNDDDTLLSLEEHNSSTLRTQRCAMHFHGLPRAFASRVLPSVITNVLIPNAVYQCDLFAFYHDLKSEGEGRSGDGGTVNPQAIETLRQAYHSVLDRMWSSYLTPDDDLALRRRTPTVKMSRYTNQDLERERGAFLNHTHTAVDDQGRLLYIPWRARFNQNTSDNIVKMWHGIQGSWNLMQQFQEENDAVTYDRVAFFRADVFYTTCLDIWRVPTQYPTSIYHRSPLDLLKLPWEKESIPHVYDVENRVAVIPAFCPANDRYMSGPYRALQIWATQRFSLIDEHVQSGRAGTGYGIHDEKFLKYTVLPSIRRQKAIPSNVNENKDSRFSFFASRNQEEYFDVQIDPTVCFVRARADDTLWVSDCGVSAEHNAQTAIAILGLSQCTTRIRFVDVTVATCH